MTRHLSYIAECFLAAVLVAGPVAAQTAPPSEPDWGRRLTINGFAGAASAEPDGGAVFGAAAGFGLSRHWAVEGSASWFNLPAGSDAFSANISVLAGFAGVWETMPFLKAGFGLHTATYDTGRATMPLFYRRGVGAPDGPVTGRHTFTDPAFVLGGGVHIPIGRQWGLRPEFDTTLVLRDGRTRTIVTGAVRLAYYFERHNITPDRKD